MGDVVSVHQGRRADPSGPFQSLRCLRARPRSQAQGRRLRVLARHYVWGSEDRRRITVAGHHQWRVEHGEIRPDGKLLVYWIENSTGAVGPGLYEIHADGSITGKWGWSEDGAKQDAKGNWQGLDRHDTLRVAAKPDA